MTIFKYILFLIIFFSASANAFDPLKSKIKWQVNTTGQIVVLSEDGQLGAFFLPEQEEPAFLFLDLTRKCDGESTVIEKMLWNINGQSVKMGRYCGPDKRYSYLPISLAGKYFIMKELINASYVRMNGHKFTSDGFRQLITFEEDAL